MGQGMGTAVASALKDLGVEQTCPLCEVVNNDGKIVVMRPDLVRLPDNCEFDEDRKFDECGCGSPDSECSCPDDHHDHDCSHNTSDCEGLDTPDEHCTPDSPHSCDTLPSLPCTPPSPPPPPCPPPPPPPPPCPPTPPTPPTPCPPSPPPPQPPCPPSNKTSKPCTPVSSQGSCSDYCFSDYYSCFNDSDFIDDWPSPRGPSHHCSSGHCNGDCNVPPKEHVSV
jgi:hypothetical protein